MASLDLSALKFINFSSVIVCVKVVENVLQSKLKCVTWGKLVNFTQNLNIVNHLKSLKHIGHTINLT